MTTYLALLRGINVGGKNKVRMADLRTCLEDLDFTDVKTYIQSGNVILDSELDPRAVSESIEDALPVKFDLDSEIIKVLTLSRDEYRGIVADAPPGFGEQPDEYHSDVIFLIDVSPEEAMEIIETHPDVDRVWPGKGVLYFSRLSAERTKSRLARIAGKAIYKSMTIRSWSTATKLATLLDERSPGGDHPAW